MTKRLDAGRCREQCRHAAPLRRSTSLAVRVAEHIQLRSTWSQGCPASLAKDSVLINGMRLACAALSHRVPSTLVQPAVFIACPLLTQVAQAEAEKFRGTAVTPERFATWRVAFEKEMAAAAAKAEEERIRREYKTAKVRLSSAMG